MFSSQIDKTEAAFRAYVSAKQHADRTEDLMDGVAAGVAWRNFLRLFYEDTHGTHTEHSPRSLIGRSLHGHEHGGEGGLADLVDRM